MFRWCVLCSVCSAPRAAQKAETKNRIRENTSAKQSKQDEKFDSIGNSYGFLWLSVVVEALVFVKNNFRFFHHFVDKECSAICRMFCVIICRFPTNVSVFRINESHKFKHTQRRRVVYQIIVAHCPHAKSFSRHTKTKWKNTNFFYSIFNYWPYITLIVYSTRPFVASGHKPHIRYEVIISNHRLAVSSQHGENRRNRLIPVRID